MFNNEPEAYHCPFCYLLSGGETELNAQRDIVLRSRFAVALISPLWWPDNEGHVLVVSAEHHEHLYDLPSHFGHGVHDIAQQVAIAMKEAYKCDGVSTRQNNEPAGGQEVWHYHLHLFPRYKGDNLYGSDPCEDFAKSERRWQYADLLRTALYSGNQDN